MSFVYIYIYIFALLWCKGRYCICKDFSTITMTMHGCVGGGDDGDGSCNDDGGDDGSGDDA